MVTHDYLHRACVGQAYYENSTVGLTRRDRNPPASDFRTMGFRTFLTHTQPRQKTQ